MPPEPSKPALQQIGDYDIIVKLAEGGMGSVYKGRSRKTGELVAIKIIPQATAKNPVLIRRFEQEYRAASLIDHTNVVKALDFCGTGPNPFLVMEFVDGESLGQRIEREGSIPEEEALRIIAQVCQGLHRAHKNGLIHRDVKPDNIMVTRDGVAKLTDLGLVKEVDGDQNLTRTGRGLGTPHYMAPEQFRNAKNADVRCDIYSLGATLYAMVTGVVPFGKVGPLDCWMKKIRNDYEEPRALNPNLSERIDWAIRRAMSGDPDKRPNNCREFVEDLHGQTIRPPAAQEAAAAANAAADVWYLVYKDDTGESHTVKGTTEGIRRAIKEQLLGDASNIRACRTKSGPFTPLTNHPEFRDIVVAPAHMPPVSSGSNPAVGNRASTAPSSGGWKAATPQPGQGRPDPDAVDFGAKGTSRGPRSSASMTPTEDVPRQTGRLPHIRLQPNPEPQATPSGRFPWWMWLLLGSVAVAAAVVAVLLLKK